MADIREDPQVWEKVLRKLRANAMPPSGMPRPEDAGLDNLVVYLEGELDSLVADNPNPYVPPIVLTPSSLKLCSSLGSF